MSPRFLGVDPQFRVAWWRWKLTVLIAAAVLAGCTEKSTKVIEPPPPEPGTISNSVEDENVRLTLSASLPATDGGVFLYCEFKNIGSQSIRYVDGGCGCPVPMPVMRDEQGEWCEWAGPRPLCPCWIETVEVPPGQGGGNGSPRECREGTASVSFTYTVFNKGDWRERNIEVELWVTEAAS